MISSFSLSSRPNLLGIHKHNSKCSPCQYYPFVDPEVNQTIASNIVEFIKKLNRKQRKVFNNLLYWGSTTGKIYIRQDTLAKYAGYCRQTVNEFIAKLVEWGFIASKYRHNMSCEYKISSFFNDMQIRSKLKQYLSALSFFPVSLLDQWIEKKTTQYNSINLLISIESNRDNGKEINNACAREKKQGNGAHMISEYVSGLEIPNVSLSVSDKICLSRYDQGVLEKAIRSFVSYRQRGDINNPVGYILAICKKESSKSNPTSERKAVPEKQVPSAERIARSNLAHKARIRGETQEQCAEILAGDRQLSDLEQEQAIRRKLWSMTTEFKELQEKALRAFPGLELLRPAHKPELTDPVQENPIKVDGIELINTQQPTDKPLSHVIHSLFMS